MAIFMPDMFIAEHTFFRAIAKTLKLRRSTVAMDNVVWFFGDVVFVSVYDISTYLLCHVFKLFSSNTSFTPGFCFPRRGNY